MKIIVTSFVSLVFVSCSSLPDLEVRSGVYEGSGASLFVGDQGDAHIATRSAMTPLISVGSLHGYSKNDSERWIYTVSSSRFWGSSYSLMDDHKTIRFSWSKSAADYYEAVIGKSIPTIFTWSSPHNDMLKN